MDFLRTPDERFENLPDYPFDPRFLQVEAGARMHYVDEGRGEPILLLHGEPTWSYLYRKMIPPLARDHRVLAPDLLGFGKSDKPARDEDHTFSLHLRSLLRLVEDLDLMGTTLVCQDWGGLLGLPLVAEAPDRFARLVIMNTGIPDGTHPMPEPWLRFRDFVARTPDLPVGMLVQRGCARPVPEAVVAAYEAPFPGPEWKAGARRLPLMVPTSPDMEAATHMVRARRFLARWTKPALVLFSDKDPITRQGEPFFRELIPGAEGQPHATIRDAGHFLQEDAGEEIADHVAAFLKANPA